MTNRINVIMPMLGGGTRMKGAQKTCKPLYVLPNGEHLFAHALTSLRNYDIVNLVLMVLPEYEEEFKKVVAREVWDGAVPVGNIYVVPHDPTENQVITVLEGIKWMKENLRRNSYPIVSLDCDIQGELPVQDLKDAVAGVFAFTHNNPNKSFIATDGDLVTRIVEKVAISDKAVFGAYMFSPTFLGEDHSVYLDCEYISQILQKEIDYGAKVKWALVENVKNYGTLEEWNDTLSGIKSYKALLFDFDGTLFDTKKLNFKAYQLAYFDLGVTITEEMFAKTDGLVVTEFNKAMGVDCNVDELKELKRQYYSDFVQYAKPNKYLIDLIKKTKLKTALVTTARRTNIQKLLEKYDLHFDVTVTQEDVMKHKPYPHAYINALEKLGLKADECLAFEDSRPGFVAARKAGCDCVMVKEFQDDCVRNMSGGSDATTKLLVIGDHLLVRKEAFGAKQAKRLKNQCEKLLAEKDNPDYISVIDYDEDEDWFMYDMPYRPAPSLYEYINKIKLLPELMQKLCQKEYTANEEDIRQYCFETYLVPGMKIYEQVTGVTLDPIYTSWEYIPSFVNNFRVTEYHGDATMENVLVERNGNLLFIDPVPDGNAVNGQVHDFSKLAQSLTGYEAIRDNIDFDYTIERHIFDQYAKELLTEDEYRSLKFHTACLLFRRLKHQIEQNPALVEVYGDMAWQLLSEFAQEKYNWD